jgi:hypothetical protein
LLKYSPIGATSPEIGLYISGTSQTTFDSSSPRAKITPAL